MVDEEDFTELTPEFELEAGGAAEVRSTYRWWQKLQIAVLPLWLATALIFLGGVFVRSKPLGWGMLRRREIKAGFIAVAGSLPGRETLRVFATNRSSKRSSFARNVWSRPRCRCAARGS